MSNTNPVERALGWVLGPPIRWAGRRVERRVRLHVALVEREVRRALPELPEPPAWLVPFVVAVSVIGAVVAERFAGPDPERTERERAEPEPEATAERGTTSATDGSEDVQAAEEAETPVQDALDVLGVERPPAPEKGDVKAAYRSLAVETHPDQGGSAERFIEVREAWEAVEEEGLSGDREEERGN